MSIPSLTQICINGIVQKPELYGPELMRRFPNSIKEVNQIGINLLKASLLPPSLEELERRLFLVHATNIFPKDRTLKPGACIVFIKEGGTIFETYRHTIHCAIGGLVQPHTLGLTDKYTNSWENQKYAFLIPFNKKQLIHLFPADSFALGAYALPSNTLCITEEENVKTVVDAGWSQEEIVTRKNRGVLREAIDQCIKERSGWLIDTKPGQGELGMFARFKEGPYRFFDLAQPYFYTSFLALNPNILSFGPATDSQALGYGGLFKQFDVKFFHKVSHSYHHSNRILILDMFENEEIQFYLNFTPQILKWDAFIDFIKEHLADKDYNEWLTWIYYSLQLIQLDLHLRKEGYYLSLDFKAESPIEWLKFRESLFTETQNTPKKEALIQETAIAEKYEQLKKMINSCNPCFRQVKKDKLFHFFGENAQLEILRNLPWERFVLFLPNMIPIDKGINGTHDSLMLCAQICYLLDKYLLTQEGHYLIQIDASIKAIQKKLSLSSEREVFTFMAENHPRLNIFLLNLLEKIDPDSSLYQTGLKLKKYFGISRPLFDDLLQKSRLKFQKPQWKIADLEKKLEEALNQKDPSIQKMLLNIWFIQLESGLDGLGWIGIGIDEQLTTWKLSYSAEWNSLLEWLARIPKEHPKIKKWNLYIKKAEKWHQKSLLDEKRFFEALSEGNPLKLI